MYIRENDHTKWDFFMLLFVINFLTRVSPRWMTQCIYLRRTCLIRGRLKLISKYIKSLLVP